MSAFRAENPGIFPQYGPYSFQKRVFLRCCAVVIALQNLLAVAVGSDYRHSLKLRLIERENSVIL